MDYKNIDDAVYVRLDKGDEILSSILDVCKKEKILSAIYSGIGACDEIEVRTHIPSKNEYRYDRRNGVLELISLSGNISSDNNNNIFEHTHAIFSYIDEQNNNACIGGHLIKAVISYTGEILINPVREGVIRRIKDDITGIRWRLHELR